ncbi:GLUG motif-containing protein [Anabaena sp. FACHB-1237]
MIGGITGIYGDNIINCSATDN